eukprot:CAMPEP_0201491656 /NCGR_PEP_ID=MMETSP0151_2-20130828/30683_1 /ASSEMBLY_ACC=CAM_ASM_000257 /TAXON_ID=200890 /ORGANISM="Paramoeba atlantica, Strain 621/1 / CCAP 1560/9" /LENGTH=419 /DNA_ID=CAMNT_0047878117 /DNA_START=34 /DNA_END=1293 /DNA_ORIENTATION=-
MADFEDRESLKRSQEHIDAALPTKQTVYRVVLCGGPCSGKTSSLVFIAEHFRSLGWHVYTVPEAATVHLHSGVSWPLLNEDQKWHFQLAIIKSMLLFEETYMKVAEGNTDGKNSLVLCDRGLMDCSAYIPQDMFLAMLKDVGISSVFEAKDDRYDLVVHLVTAANGKETHYTLANNTIRRENPEEARVLDGKILKAWSGHPQLHCVDNRTLFKEKVMRALSLICRQLQVSPPSHSVVKRKFLVSEIHDDWKNEDGSPASYTEFDCEYVYLLDAGDVQQRLKKRISPEGATIYTHVTRQRGPSGTHERYTETKRKIKSREYEVLLGMALPDHSPILLKKRAFVYKNQNFHLAVHKGEENPSGAPWMQLEVYEDLDHTIELPESWVKLEKEVTKLKEYSMVMLARKEHIRNPTPPPILREN